MLSPTLSTELSVAQSILLVQSDVKERKRKKTIDWTLKNKRTQCLSHRTDCRCADRLRVKGTCESITRPYEEASRSFDRLSQAFCEFYLRLKRGTFDQRGSIIQSDGASERYRTIGGTQGRVRTGGLVNERSLQSVRESESRTKRTPWLLKGTLKIKVTLLEATGQSAG
jgi:hypothetical protein